MTSQAPESKPPQSFSGKDCVWILLGGILLLLARGFRVYVVNQNTYFLYGLRLSDPGFIPLDHFTWQTHHAHIAFSYLLVILRRLGPLEVTTIIAQGVCFALFSGAVWSLCHLAADRPKTAYAGVMLWIALAGPESMGLGGLYMISDYFQPSQVGGSCIVLGFAMLFRRRFLVSAILFGVGGILHFGVLVSCLPVIICQAWACGVRRSKSDLLRFSVPLILLWGMAFAMAWRVGGMGRSSAEDVARSREIIIHFLGPYHFVLRTWPLPATALWAGLVFLGGAALWLRPVSSPEQRALRVSYLVSVLVCAGSILLTKMGINQTLTLLAPWRVSHWALLLGLVALQGHLLTAVLGNAEERAGAPKRQSAIWMDAFLWAGTAVVCCLWMFEIPTIRKGMSVLPFLWRGMLWLAPAWLPVLSRRILKLPGRSSDHFLFDVLVLAMSCFIALWAGILNEIKPCVLWVGWMLTPFLALEIGRIGRRISFIPASPAALACIGFAVLFSASAIYGVRNHSRNGAQPAQGDWAQALQWIRRETPPDSVFATPPFLQTFRLGARRAIVADAFAGALWPRETLEWYQRICDLCGFDPKGALPADPQPAVEKGYERLNSLRARMLAQKYGIDYILAQPDRHKGDLSGLPRVFYNPHFAVYRIPADARN